MTTSVERPGPDSPDSSDNSGSPDGPDGPDSAATAGLARAAGLSGVIFAALFTASLVLVAQGPGLGAPDSVYTAFYSGGGQNLIVTAGLYLVPFAGIAFLWHMIATRTLLVSAPSMPGWLQLAAGVLVVALLFTGTAVGAGAALLSRFSTAAPPSPDVARALAAVGYAVIFVFVVRAAGMYVITTTGLARTAGLMSRPVSIGSYVVAVLMLFSTTFHPAVLLVFPAWVLVMSVLLLMRRHTGGSR